jgi:hypothetical protein
LATIEHAIFVERSTNPNCPLADLINEAIRMGDIDFAYRIACDSLKPRKKFGQRIIKLFRGKLP